MKIYFKQVTAYNNFCLNCLLLIVLGKEIIVGIGNYTNKEGAQCVAKAFPEYAVTIITLPEGVKHLHQIMTMAGPDVIVVPRGQTAQKCLQVCSIYPTG